MKIETKYNIGDEIKYITGHPIPTDATKTPTFAIGTLKGFKIFEGHTDYIVQGFLGLNTIPGVDIVSDVKEEKNKVKLYLYSYKGTSGKWYNTNEYSKDDEDFKTKTGWLDKFMRLDDSMIEVEED